MNQKQRKIKLQHRQRPKSEPIKDNAIYFGYTKGYIIWRKIMQYVAPIFFAGVLAIIVFYSIELPDYWYYTILSISAVGLCIYGMFRYGKPGRIFKHNDVYIKDNKIYYSTLMRTNYGYGGDTFVISSVKKVKVKWNKIIIYGEGTNEAAWYKNRFTKLVFPKALENVDEFIRMAESLIGKE